jgi:y4mF family transcriptional regulator
MTGPRARSASARATTDLGALVARRRAVLGVTQDELADLAGVSRRSVTSIEAGKLTVRLDILVAVLAALGLAVVVLPRRRARAAAEGPDAASVVGR